MMELQLLGIVSGASLSTTFSKEIFSFAADVLDGAAPVDVISAVSPVLFIREVPIKPFLFLHLVFENLFEERITINARLFLAEFIYILVLEEELQRKFDFLP